MKEWNELCQDSNLCRDRIGREEFATKKCQLLLQTTNVEGSGIMYDNNNITAACSIACKYIDEPRWRWNVINSKEAIFPDGTLCHMEHGEKFYCQNGLCKPVKSIELESEK